VTAARAGSAKPEGRRARGAGPGWRARARGALPFAVAALSGFLAAYLAVYLFVFPSRLVPDDRPVPDVRGRLVDDADRALRDAGFVPRTGQRRVDASVVAGTVVSQSPPPAASRPRGSAVVLDVSAEP
jgi:beta-lactam-binding protein with PASTA domain